MYRALVPAFPAPSVIILFLMSLLSSMYSAFATPPASTSKMIGLCIWFPTDRFEPIPGTRNTRYNAFVGHDPCAGPSYRMMSHDTRGIPNHVDVVSSFVGVPTFSV